MEPRLLIGAAHARGTIDALTGGKLSEEWLTEMERQFQLAIDKAVAEKLAEVRDNAMALDYTNSLDAARIATALDTAIAEASHQEPSAAAKIANEFNKKYYDIDPPEFPDALQQDKEATQ